MRSGSQFYESENPVVIKHDTAIGALKGVNTRKAAGPGGIFGWVLKSCAGILTPVFTTIFNLSLTQSLVPTCFKQSAIVPMPKTASTACLNDYRPVALTSVAMKCFEK